MNRDQETAGSGGGKSRHTATKLRKERDVLAAIVDIAGALIVVLNREGSIVYFNRACEETTGYSAKEMRGKRVWDVLICPEEIQSVQTVFTELQAGAFPIKNDNYWLTRDGDRRLITWTNTVITDSAGEVLYVIATGLDVTDKRAAYAELQQRTHDLGERVKELNCLYGISRLREQTDLPLAELYQRVVELIPPAWQYPEVTCGRIVVEGQAYMSANFKETRWRLSSEINADGQHVGVVEVYYLERKPKLAEGPFLSEERALIDAIAERLGRVIEREHRREQLLEYQARLRELASELSLSEERERHRIARELHDEISQTLALAKIKLDGLRAEEHGDELGEIVELINQTITRTRSLTTELSPPVLHELGFEAALEWLVTNTAEEHGFTAKFADDGSPKPLGEDTRVMLFQVVRELLLNVVKHAQAKHVEVRISTVDGSVQLDVRDDGIGFDYAEVISRRGKDHAFGLFSVRERLSHVGGKAEIRSSPGAGTRALLICPLDLERATVNATDDAALRQEGNNMIGVLLVDDQRIIRQGLRALLEKHPDLSVVGEAADGEEAVELTGTLKPDVVVMDVAMPGMNGIEATKRIAAQRPETRVIALSMHSDGQFVLEMLRAGAAGYMLKDSAHEDLAHAIRMVNSKLTFVSHGIADSVIQDYVRRQQDSRAAGDAGLTPREEEVLKLLADGNLTKQIAQQLGVSVKTIEAHRQHIMEKLGVQSLAELTKYAIREKLISLEPE